MAHYGEKQGQFKSVLETCQKILSTNLGQNFHPYELKQIHGTIIGMEMRSYNHQLINEFFLQNYDQTRPIDFEKLLLFIKSTFQDMTFEIQWGGFQFDKALNTVTQNPYSDSISIQTGNVVGKGWPVFREKNRNTYCLKLDQLRTSFQQVNILHKYHRSEACIDNDFFFVIGKLEDAVDPLLALETEKQIRDLLAKEGPIYLPISSSTVSLVIYSDTQLPPQSTKVFHLDTLDFNNLSADQCQNLLSEQLNFL